jgi:hypothetical protein
MVDQPHQIQLSSSPTLSGELGEKVAKSFHPKAEMNSVMTMGDWQSALFSQTVSQEHRLPLRPIMRRGAGSAHEPYTLCAGFRLC